VNTRRYPRTAAEAFPNSCAYACAVERPPRRRVAPFLVVGLLLSVLLLAAR
jgi:hypothetical protein